MTTFETASGLTLIAPHREPTARRACQAAEANIAVLLAALHDRLAACGAKAAADPANWGHAGTLGAVQERLTELVDFLS